MENTKKNKFVEYGRIGWIYTKYQLLTKSILFMVIFPLFKFALKHLILSTGRTSISSGDYLGFLLSFQGFGFLLLILAILTILIGLDINAFIIMSALIKENKIKLTARHLFIVSIKSLKLLLKPSGLLIMLYIAIVVPLVGLGLSVSVMKNFKIPNFIMDVIFNNNLYFSIYITAILILTILTFMHIFFFHYLIIENQTVGKSLKKSFILMKKHWKEFIKEFFIKRGLLYIGFIAISVATIFIMLYFTQKLTDVSIRRFSSIFIVLNVAELFWYTGLMIIPILSYTLTDLFYKFNEKDGNKISIKININAEAFERIIGEKVKLRTKFSLGLFFIVVTLINIVLSIGLTSYFDEVFKPKRNIDIVAHRAGGDLAAENSILGMNKAMELGAKWSEIDVQRTKDNHYIINHDPTLSRVTGINKKSTDLTLAEIKKLKIKNLFDPNGDPQPIPTIEEFLDSAKGKIGLFIELKGESADEKMADDVVNMIKNRGMEKETAILSLDYKLISYVEDKYPEIKTGYLYFFSMGDASKIKSDILIMEEQEATPEKIEWLHEAGKKVIVWTVNTDESVKKFVSSEVDGIITDYVKKVKDGIKTRDNRNDIQVIIESILK